MVFGIKTYGYKTKNLWFSNQKPMVIKLKTYGFQKNKPTVSFAFICF